MAEKHTMSGVVGGLIVEVVVGVLVEWAGMRHWGHNNCSGPPPPCKALFAMQCRNSHLRWTITTTVTGNGCRFNVLHEMPSRSNIRGERKK